MLVLNAIGIQPAYCPCPYGVATSLPICASTVFVDQVIGVCFQTVRNDDPQENLPFDEMGDEEGLFDAQLSLPLFAFTGAGPVEVIRKRDGRQEPFDKRKIAAAILRAAPEGSTLDADTAESIASAVAIFLSKRLNGLPATADQVSDAVERVLLQMSQVEAGLAYARYRDRRARIRRLRKGDMQALLNELEEARHERSAVLARDIDLNVQTSQDRLVKWDRNRIVEALQLETGLDVSLASIIAAEVENQIKNAGITVLTAPLIRELVGAKLIEHGLAEENDLHRRLGVPLYDASRIIRGCAQEAFHATPSTTDDILARAVKKEYALAEVFSAPVTQAHLLGRIHINELEYVDRLYACEQTLMRESDLWTPQNSTSELRREDEPPAAIVSNLMKQHDFLQSFFSGPLDWYAFNFLAAPVIPRAGDAEMRAFARMFIRECAYRASSGAHTPVRVSLFWNVPPRMTGCDGLGAQSTPPEEVCRALEPVARRLFAAMLEACRGRDLSADDASFPRIEVVLENDLFKTFEGNDVLLLAARTALENSNVCFTRKETLLQTGGTPAGSLLGNLHVTWHRVALNLPRAAVATENEHALLDELDTLCEIAVTAHVQKRAFTEALLDPEGCAPLAPLARVLQKSDSFYMERGRFLVAVDGLYEAAEIVLGTGQATFAARIRLMEKILAHLGETLTRIADREGISCVLAANVDPDVSSRFAAVDAGFYPRLVDAIIRQNNQTQELSYTTGVALPKDYVLNPFERARIEGIMHEKLGGRPFTCMPIPIRNASENTVSDLLKKVFHQTGCKGLRLIQGPS